MPTGPERRESALRKIGHFLHDTLIERVFPEEDVLSERPATEPPLFTQEKTKSPELQALMNDPYADAETIRKWSDNQSFDEAS